MLFKNSKPPLSLWRAWAFLGLLILALAGHSQEPAAPQEDSQPPEAQNAQNAQEAGAVIPAERIQSLLNTLEDPLAREAFLERLRTLVEVQQAPAEEEAPDGLADTLLAAASQSINEFSGQLADTLQYLEQAPAVARDVYAAVMRPEIQRILLEVAGKIVGVFTTALLGAWLVRRLLARGSGAIEQKKAKSPVAQVFFMVASLILKLVPLAAFMAIGYLVLPLLDPRPVTRVVLLTLVNAHVIAQSLVVIARTLLAVDAPSLRPYPMQDETAAYVYVWFRRLTLIVVYGYFIAQALLLMGLEFAVYAMLVNLIGFFVGLLLISLVLQSRAGVAAAIRGQGVPGVMGQLRSTFAVLWHVLAIAYIVGVFIVWAFEVEGGFTYLLQSTVLSVVVLVAMRLAVLGIERGMSRIFHVPENIRRQYPQLEERANRYRPVIEKILKGLTLIIGVMAVLEAWGIDALAFLVTDVGSDLIARIARIAFIIALSFLVWEVVAVFIERQLKRHSGNSKRVQTLLPFIKNVVRALIIVLGTMITLSEIGMDIGPLLASAGVIGLAIGFGAQTLVRDLITGMFVILEDIIGVGDWVEVAGHAGMVESMSIRTVRLRDLNGNVRIIPFGEVASVHKVADDYSYALVVVGVAYRENTDEVIKLLHQVAEAMRWDDDWGPKIISPMEVQGVVQLNASSVDVRVRLRCRPLEQWGVQREFLRRTKLLFDEKGVEIPFPHQTIYFGADKQGQAPAANVQLREAPAEPAPEPAPPEDEPPPPQSSGGPGTVQE